MVDECAESNKATDLPELRTVPHRLAAGWGGVGRVAVATVVPYSSGIGFECMDIRSSLPEFDFDMEIDLPEETASPTPPVTADTPVGLARWLEDYAARLADPEQLLPTLDELAAAHLSDTLLAPLREQVARGEAEDAVVAALLHVFLNHGPDCRLPHNTRRALRVRFRKQVPAPLAVVVEQQVRAWCAAGKA